MCALCDGRLETLVGICRIASAMTSAAKCEVVSLQYGENEQQMNAKVEVSNFLAMDTLGTVAHQVEKAVYAISLKQHDNRWLVDLNRLPQRVK